MNAQHSFEPPEYSIQRRRSSASQQLEQFQSDTPSQSKTELSPRKRSRSKVKSTYAHRRQGLEAGVKLVTYSVLSVFGIVSLVNSVSNNWSLHGKVQHLKTEVQDAKIRTEKINQSFSRSFDPQAQKSMMEDNSYKIAPNRRQIILVTEPINQSVKATGK